MDSNFSLAAISPLDGRYAASTSTFKDYFSEFALIKHRIQVEVEWFRVLAEADEIVEVETFSSEVSEFLKSLCDITMEDAQRVKAIEKVTNHDVKAIEYFVKERLAASGWSVLEKNKEFLHFGCTSEDINNIAYALMLKHAVKNVLRLEMVKLTKKIGELAVHAAEVPLLGRTHGQPATPTTFGKELATFASRFRHHISNGIDKVQYFGKFSGAVGNFNAHLVAYPAVNWPALSRKLVEDRCGLVYQQYSTQSESHDFIAELCDAIARFNTTLIDFNADMWHYISRDILKLKMVDTEVGSSAMPHKVNPIDFENSEGNLGISNALLKFFSMKLPISRLQRDLSDSTVLRNIGCAMAHSLIAYQSTLKGLNKIEVNSQTVASELDDHWAVLAEPIQTVMRKGGIESPYEQLKAFSRGQSIDRNKLKDFIATHCAELKDEERQKLMQLSPHTYTGLASDLAKAVLSDIALLGDG